MKCLVCLVCACCFGWSQSARAGKRTQTPEPVVCDSWKLTRFCADSVEGVIDLEIPHLKSREQRNLRFEVSPETEPHRDSNLRVSLTLFGNARARQDTRREKREGTYDNTNQWRFKTHRNKTLGLQYTFTVAYEPWMSEGALRVTIGESWSFRRSGPQEALGEDKSRTLFLKVRDDL